MEQFFLDLQPAIEKAVRHTMEKIRLEIGKEHIYSAALVTDSDCITLFLAVNTEEALARRDETDRTPERLAELRKYWSEELVSHVADGSFSLNRYIPDEWGYSDGTNSELNQVSRQLYDQEATLSDTDDDAYDEVHEQFQEQFLETVALVFETLQAEGVFAPETLCFISMSDDDRTPDIEDDSARRLNTPEQYEQFQTWASFFNG
ncbi:DUF4303 domain-containing protein [uncultured Oscillibacter sp.]|uniref:DUF4303 domain-containing protein n=1 Tax=uncultured Oscillibacter sp. TaxID=876091 RepID=UPI00262019CB|nr:DUF4303 domain-containing protein [uncultured Oscillibacter sp.]